MPRYERIGETWPRDPDPQDVSDEFLRTARVRRLPFSVEHPLLFHVLTTLDEHGEGEEQLLRLMADGVALVPRAAVESREGSIMFARDVVAGDDQYLFTTPGNVFSNFVSMARRNPAVAFDARWVAKRRSIAFRPSDMEPFFKRIEAVAGDYSPVEDAIDPDEWEGMSDAERAWATEEAVAEMLRGELEAIVECGTQYGEEALALVMLYNRLIGSFREGYKPNEALTSSWVADDDPERLYLWESAEMLLPSCPVEEIVSMAWESGVSDRLMGSVLDDIRQSWERCFRAPGNAFMQFPHLLLFADREERPEVLVEGSLPLCEAAFYRDSEGRWLPVPEEICSRGRVVMKNRATG